MLYGKVCSYLSSVALMSCVKEIEKFRSAIWTGTFKAAGIQPQPSVSKDSVYFPSR